MLELEYYEDLPETLEQSFIEDEILSIIGQISDETVMTKLDCIWELTLRQANNRNGLGRSVSGQLAKFIINNWDSNSEESTGLCLSIALNLELKLAFNFILDTYQNSKLNDEVSDVVRDFIEN